MGKSEPARPGDRDGFDKKKWAAENNLKEIGGNWFKQDWDIGQEQDYEYSRIAVNPMDYSQGNQ